MPKVHCSHCGEELLGSVNRCWRCGRTFVAEHNPENLPPIRRRPIPLELVHKTLDELKPMKASVASPAAIAAEIIGDPAVAALAPPETATAVSAQDGQAADLPPAMIHVGPQRVSTTPAATPYYTSPPPPAYPTNAGAMGGAIAAVVLGVMALASIRLILPGALLVSILGVAMGVWGLHSDRRGLAVLGLVLCCLAMAIAGFLSAVALFEMINGYNPFEGDLPPVEMDGLEPL